MSLKKHGRLIVDIEGISLSDADVHLIQDPNVGGLILFDRNFNSQEQLKSLCKDIRDIKEDILIAVDHEGGRVQRFKKDFTQIPSMQSLGSIAKSNHAQGLALAKDIGWLLASELIACGIDISFTPVLDLDTDKSIIIGDRAFSDDPQLVIDLAEALIYGMQEAGMSATGKHFPGHGGVFEDSHLEAPIDNRELEELFEKDLKPYIVLKDILSGVMTAHLTYPKIDSEAVSFSYFWLTTFMREQIGFKGVIFSDDLSMKGADIAGSYSEKARKSLEAGCDMLIVCNNRQGAKEVADFLTKNNISKISKIQTMLKTKDIDWNNLQDDPRRLDVISRIKDLGVQ